MTEVLALISGIAGRQHVSGKVGIIGAAIVLVSAFAIFAAALFFLISS
jgi:hypothetical protein